MGQSLESTGAVGSVGKAPCAVKSHSLCWVSAKTPPFLRGSLLLSSFSRLPPDARPPGGLLGPCSRPRFSVTSPLKTVLPLSPAPGSWPVSALWGDSRCWGKAGPFPMVNRRNASHQGGHALFAKISR